MEDRLSVTWYKTAKKHLDSLMSYNSRDVLYQLLRASIIMMLATIVGLWVWVAFLK